MADNKKDEKEFENNGLMLAKGIAEGMKNGADLIKTASEKLISAAVSGAKKAAGIHSPSSVMRDEVGKYLSLGVAQGLTENDKFVTKAFKEMLAKLDYQRSMDIINDDKYYAELENLRDRYFAKGSSQWVLYTEKIYEYQKKTLENQKKVITDIYGDISDYANDKLDEVIKKQENYAQKLLDFGGMYKKRTILLDDGNIEYYALRDFDADIKSLEKYNLLLSEVKSKINLSDIADGAKNSILTEIGSMPIEKGMMYLEALKNANDGDFGKYISGYGKKFNLSQGISSNQYKDEMADAIDQSTQYMKDKLTEAGFEIPDGFFASGSISAENFGASFVEQLDAELAKIRTKIEDFNASLNLNVSVDSEKSKPQANTYKKFVTTYNISSDGNANLVTDFKRLDTLRRLSGAEG